VSWIASQGEKDQRVEESLPALSIQGGATVSNAFPVGSMRADRPLIPAEIASYPSKIQTPADQFAERVFDGCPGRSPRSTGAASQSPMAIGGILLALHRHVFLVSAHRSFLEVIPAGRMASSPPHHQANDEPDQQHEADRRLSDS